MLKKLSNFTYLILISVFIISCDNKQEPQSVKSNITFSRETKMYKSGNDCDMSDSIMTDCAIIDLSWLNPIGSDNKTIKSIKDTLDLYILGMIKECIYQENIQSPADVESIEKISALYFTQHKDFVAEFPDAASQVWSIEIYVDSIFQNDKIISLAINGYTFLGGAHPNSYTFYYNFDKLSGKTLVFSDFIIDKKKFIKIAETEFRKNQELSDNQNLDEAGYFFDNAVYTLPQQFCFTSNGVLLMYNAYEAAAYAVGPISYTIPYESLVDIVDFSRFQ